MSYRSPWEEHGRGLRHLAPQPLFHQSILLLSVLYIGILQHISSDERFLKLRLHFVGEELEAEGCGVTCSGSQWLSGAELRAEFQSQFLVQCSLFYHMPFSTSPPKLGNFFSIDAHSHGTTNIAEMADTDQKMKSVISHLNNCYDVIWILASSSYPVFHELGD